MNDRPKLSFGIKTSQSGITYDDILRIWREADTIDVFEHAWLWDHMIPLRGPVTRAALEAWTLLAALAAQTRRLRLGVIVTSNRLRPPTVLAKMAATVDIVSAGRLEFGIGAGGSEVRGNPAGLEMVHREFDAYGIPVVPPGEAVRALAEACTIIRRMPPILIGAGGERALRVVAEHADVWNCPTGDAQEFRRKSQILDEHCATVGRSPGEITRSVQILVPGDDPAASRAKLLELIDAGVTHLVLAPLAPLRPAAWLADEIIEPVLAEVRSG